MRSGIPIEFSVATPDIVTKAEVSVNDLKANTNLYLYAAKSDGTSSYPITDAPGARLYYNSARNVWDAKYYVDIYNNWGYVIGEEEVNMEWESNSYYTFYGFTFTSYDTSAGAELTISNQTYGRQFTVTQPASGSGEKTIDYLLSSLVSVAPTTNYPLVPIELEHAMSRVDVDVQIADAMFNGTTPLVKDIQITISGIRRKATMLCLQPKAYGEEGTNTWHITFDANAGTASYMTPVDNSIANIEGNDPGINDMSFMAVPVTNAEMDGYVLTLEYNNASKTTPSASMDYTYSFNLKDFSPKGWVNAHKVKYLLTIDNSIHLEGSVVDYQDVDYIESVLVPDIPGTK